MTIDHSRLNARIGAYAMHARHSARETTRKAREAAWQRFIDQVDPDRVLEPEDREQRARAARHAHMLRMAQRSVEAREQRMRASLRQPGPAS